MQPVYKFVAAGEGLKRLLGGSTVRFTPPTEFNDPFEFGFDTGSLLKKMGPGMASHPDFDDLEYTDQDWLDFIGYVVRARILQTYSQQYGVLCLSEICDDELLWGHYAGRHAGIAVGFDRSHPFFGTGPLGERSGLLAVQYSQVPEPYAIKNVGSRLPSAVLDTFFVKSAAWNSEREVRTVALLNDPLLFPARSVAGVATYPPEAVVEIIVGFRASEETLVEVFELQSSLYPHAALLTTWPDPSGFRVRVGPVPSLEFMLRARKVLRSPLEPIPPFGHY